MLDAVTGKPIQIKVYRDERRALAFIDLPASQLDAVSKLFDEHGVPHWQAHMLMSFDGGPQMGMIHLRQKADPDRAQEILDSAP